MDCYFDPPSKYALTEPPVLHQIRTNIVRLFSPDLQSQIVHYMQVNTRADSVNCILRRGSKECAECLETFIPPDSICNNTPSPSVLNWWSHVHSWVTKQGGMKTHLSSIFLTEEFLGDDNLSKKISTYVDFTLPDVVIMNRCERQTRSHEALVAKFDSFMNFGIEKGKNSFCVYYKDHKVNVTGHLAMDFAYLDIKRTHNAVVLHGLGSCLKNKKKRGNTLVIEPESVGANFKEI